MPKKGTVRPEYVRQPAAMSLWPPPDSVHAHRIKDGENWWSLQKDYSLPDPWDLIRYNFRTDDPLEVNWYLRGYVGCDTVTEDEKNYAFSSTAQPGSLFLPPWAVLPRRRGRPFILIPRFGPVPHAPRPPSYRVPGVVPLLRQAPGSSTCWAHAAAMLMSWRDGTIYTVADAMDRAGWQWRSLFDRDKGLPPADFAAFAADCGMTCQPNACFTFAGWLALIKRCGPVGVLIVTGAKLGHAAVLTGTHGSWMLLTDPAQGRVSSAYPGFSEKYEAYADGGDTALLWHFGPVFG
jgi:Papain-like cysteine protease AvrRpt2